jgi:hypothetical protein
MPNHINGIVIIVDIDTSFVETLHATSLPSERMVSGRDQGVSTISKWNPGTLGAIIKA